MALRVLAFASMLLCQVANAQFSSSTTLQGASSPLASQDGVAVDDFGLGLEDAETNVDGSVGRANNLGGNPAAYRKQRRTPTPVAKAKPTPLSPNSFQRFVQSSTGQLLPLYGIAAFEQGVDFGPARSGSVPADYVIGPGDEILLQVTGVADQQMRLIVDGGGRITLPKVGTFSMIGVRASELEAALEKQLQKSFRNFTLSASLGAIRPIDVYVVGQARVPGRQSVSAMSSFVSAVLSMGGPNGNGGLRRVELVRDGATIATLDVYAFLASGKAEADTRLQAGDTLVFPAAGPRVALLGDVNAAAVYELARPDEPLSDLLKLIGGLPVTANRRRATVERVDPMARDPRRVEAMTLDDAGLHQPLRDGDIITFLPISPAFGNAVTLRGNVASPMRYPFTAGMRVRDLIPDREALISPDYYRRKNLLVQFDDTVPVAAGTPATTSLPPTPLPPAKTQQSADAESTRRNVKEMLDEVNWEYAAVERLDKETLTTKLLPFHLGKAVLQGDDAQNLALEAGDVVTVFSARDLAVPQAKKTRLVRIEGEVGAPGIYQITADETLASLLDRVGGTTAQAYLFGLALRRESVRQAQQATLDNVLRQLEDELRAHLATRQANLPTSGEASQMVAFQAQLQFEERFALDRIARLRAAKPEGRISLEQDPAAATIPEVRLEDGDAIVVPVLPSFVSIVGAVQNENGLIWKEGRTVGEYLAVAGVTPNADLDNVYVLRADGSIRSRDRGFWGWVPAQNHGLALEPGDVVIVPERMDLENGYTILVRGLKDWTQILANMGIAVASTTLLLRP